MISSNVLAAIVVNAGTVFGNQAIALKFQLLSIQFTSERLKQDRETFPVQSPRGMT
jgi:hypothetical protein